MNFQDIPILFEEKLMFFQSLLPFDSNNWQPYNSKKSSPSPILSIIDPKTHFQYFRSQKTLNFSKNAIFSFLYNAYPEHYLIDERQGKSLFLTNISPNLHLLYYFLRSPNENILENLEMFEINGFYIEKNEIFIVRFSLDQAPADTLSGFLKIQCPVNGYVIKELAENSCEISHICCKQYPNRLNLLNFDWNQGQELEKVEKCLIMNFMIHEPPKTDPSKSIPEVIKKFIEDAKSEINKENKPWISKYEDLLKITEMDLDNVEKVDLYNLYGEPYKPKVNKARILKHEAMKGGVVRGGNVRTNEYLINLMMKNKK